MLFIWILGTILTKFWKPDYPKTRGFLPKPDKNPKIVTRTWPKPKNWYPNPTRTRLLLPDYITRPSMALDDNDLNRYLLIGKNLWLQLFTCVTCFFIFTNRTFQFDSTICQFGDNTHFSFASSCTNWKKTILLKIINVNDKSLYIF